MAHIVYSGAVKPAEGNSGLFAGRTFWLSQKVPQRSRFVDDIKSNGGHISPLEKQADVKIVDHARKDQMPGSYSYTFIEASVRKGVLEDLKDHAVGPPEGAVRIPGSMQPAKTTRTKYTSADDSILWEWVQTHPQSFGSTDGNEIYKQLEKKHPHHPWQSWRDRYIKKLKERPRPYALPHNAPLSPLPETQAQLQPTSVTQNVPDPSAKPMPFTKEDEDELMKEGEDIMNMDPDVSTIEAWRSFVKDFRDEEKHTAEQWQTFWETIVRPRFLRERVEQMKETKSQAGVGHSPEQSGKSNSHRSNTQVIHHTIEEGAHRRRTPSHTSDTHAQRDKTRSPSIKLESPHPLPRFPTTSRAVAVSIPSISLSEQARKRKLMQAEEEAPSSSPPRRGTSPQRFLQRSSPDRREIPSTPDKSPYRPFSRHASPLFVEQDPVEAKYEQADILMKVEDHDDQLDDMDDLAEAFSPTWKMKKTDHRSIQSLLREPTPYLDFNIAPPDGGWDSREGSEDYNDLPEGDAKEFKADDQIRPAMASTQAIFDGATQIPDLYPLLPELEDFGSVPPSSPQDIPRLPPRAESVVSSSNLSAEQDAWIESFVSRGFSVETVETILASSSLNSKVAADALESLPRDARMSTTLETIIIPEDRRGVWTAADDNDLSSTDARRITKLEEKHGKDSISSRWEFLDFWNSSLDD